MTSAAPSASAPLDAATPTAATPAATPHAGNRRIAALDVLRGIAIVGTLATNIGLFVYFGANESTFEQGLDTAIRLVTDGKYIGLLTIMFGIGLEVQRQSALRRGDPWLGTYPWRAAILILDGLVNYIFVFQFDVLMGYGLTGLVMCLVLCTTPRAQAWVMGVGVAVHLAYLTYLSWPTGSDPSEAARAAEAESASASGRGSYWSGVRYRLEYFWDGRAEIPIMFTMGIGLFLAGAFLYRAGLFEERGRRLRLWVMGLSFGVGLPIDWALRLWVGDATGIFNRYLTSALVSFGILALVAHFYARGRTPGRMGTAVSKVGRMALTCYIGQNLVASVIFFDWGLGLGAKLDWGVWTSIAGWLVITALMIGFSTLWLRRFSRGPVEWLWHVMHAWIVARTTTRWRERKAVNTSH